MPAKDTFDDAFKYALEKDSWTITHDPYRIMLGRKRGYIDLAAEKIIAAEKNERKIAVEIKSFIGVSDLDEFEDALGQFLIYKVALEKEDIERELFFSSSGNFLPRFF